jgi:hypothetical protein
VGAAIGVIVTSDNGSCDLTVGSAEKVSIYCDLGDLSATIDEAVAQTGSGFETGFGSIYLSVPADGVFSVQATGDSVTAEDMPDECVLNAASESAKTLSCNGATTDDPVYEANADGDVIFTF